MLEMQPVQHPALGVLCRFADTAEAYSNHEFCAFEFPVCEGCPNAVQAVATVGRREDPMKSKVMNGWIVGNSSMQNAVASERDHVLEEHIRGENLARLKNAEH